ncbi:putative membrane protein [Stieleria maiorica]|uniref:Putative membrane protein n=1 Tax=Stieleria maiorica TaxID=2795974 RepID=A0A5B9MCW1_9BACT|nr:tellurite resistance/C4-dicarboxylate transporter family protein [Stieleria maiorica]QEF97780.1 putative membrane protein [Stieleria maiorica]
MKSLLRASSTLNPAYFALVMATGTVSTACHLLELPVIPTALFGINIAAFLSLVILSALRAIFFPRLLMADLIDHKRGVGFFTTVAACCVVGIQFLLLANAPAASVTLWTVGVVLGLALTNVVFTSLTVKQSKPTLAEGIHGDWLVSVVATQAVSVLGGMLSERLGSHREIALFFSASMWLAGGMLYIWIISLIFYRYTFFAMSASEMSPPYWINMGAMAISTLAGATLVSKADSSPILLQLLPFIKGLTLLFWATATWWIPMLVTLGIWRHVYKRVAFAYDPQYWSIVFPIGMYAVCTIRLAQELDAPYLLLIPNIFVYIALVAWGLTFLTMLRSLWKLRGH